MPKATAVFDADDSRLSGRSRISGKMLALQSRIAKFAAANSLPAGTQARRSLA